MRIRAFHIDGFGILSQVAIDDLPPGVSVFLGQNEAGKSTCLEFFRTMLTGYPLPRTKDGKKSWALAGHKQGGTLHLECPDGRILRLVRQPGAAGGIIRLYDGEGQAVDIAEYERLLGGVSREVYRNIYGFSLSELQSFETLDSEAVRNALYGAGFGMGMKTPGVVLARMQNEMEELFKSRGKNQPLNAALRRWDELKIALREAEGETTLYDSLAQQGRVLQKGLDSLQEEKFALEEERRNLERRLGVWKQWEEWRLIQTKLERLEAVAGNFPLDGLARLDRLMDRNEEAQRHLGLALERIARINAGLQGLEGDARLLPLEDAIRELSERKSSCRNALIALPTQKAALQRAQDSLNRQLASLGPDWNMERIHAMDRSLFVREELERRASAMQAAESTVMTLTTALERTTQDAEHAKNEVDFARQALERMPESGAGMDLSTRNALQTQLSKLEESRQRLPDRQKALATARAEYAKALAYLNLRPDTSLEMLETLSEAQDGALQLAGEMRERTQEVSMAEREVQTATKEVDAAQVRLQRLQAQIQELGSADRQILDEQRVLLRRLRQSSLLLHQEEDRYLDLHERCSAQEAISPKQRNKIPELVAGGFFAVIGVIVLTSQLAFGVESVDLGGLWANLGLSATPPGWAGVINLLPWPSYVLLLVGILLLFLGWPWSKDKENAESQLSQLRARRDTSEAQLNELRREVQNLCLALGLESWDPSFLDDCDMRLDRERERCAASERLQQEKLILQSELEGKRGQLKEREADLALAETAVQTARRRWHNQLMRLGVVNIPLPEAAAAFFARVEAIRMAHGTTAALEEELKELQGRSAIFMQTVRQLLPASVLPKSIGKKDKDASSEHTAEEEQMFMDTVRRVLDNCRQADSMAEDRSRAVEALRIAESTAARCTEACAAARETLQHAQNQRAVAIAGWRKYLTGLGLDPGLSPLTTREALDSIERCLAMETECARLREDIALHERERDALTVPLTEILQSLGRAPHLGLDKEPDWLGTLDILQRELDKALRAGEEEKRLLAQRKELEAELNQSRQADRDARQALETLLQQGGANDSDHFRHLASVLVERLGLQRRADDLKDALRLAAGDTSLEEFLKPFANLERGTMESRNEDVVRRLEGIREEAQQQSAELAVVDARLKELEQSNRLAQLRMEEAALEEEIDRLSQEWSRYALARQLLLEARLQYEKERQPEVVRLASDLFSTITGGKWPRIAASFEDNTLLAVPKHGDPIAPELLSRGTQEQLYLALRMAHIRSQGRRSTSLPVIMDDIMVNFDPERTQRTIQALGELAAPHEEGQGHQILYFTCHPQIADAVLKLVPNSALFKVEAGTITAA